ncbi:helix-turn-helix domain-containing protein [Maribellus comscasis]|uniref:Helix-turn-helix domain-containing protein n=1 Tax=Maribellus comscasis TaxID=2681766 RepID=A0A6I6JMC5_9BACT|nr:helix-turn-helix domain-containing protein [Maribellus comscasis]QGY42110.1 helix-turn-helix domain-containing protein [Maribellus comscasis]
MFLWELPQLQNKNHSFQKSKENLVVFAKSCGNFFYPKHRSPYLFLTNFLNPGNYYLNESQTQVREKSFYFLNADDSIAIDYSKPVTLQTLLILFDDEFIENCITNLLSTEEQLLNFNTKKINFHIPTVPFELNERVQKILCFLINNSSYKENVDFYLYELVSEFVKMNDKTSKQIQKIDAVKTSTKTELYKRLFIAREFIRENVSKKITLDEIALEASLNKYHLLSNFKQLFQCTPHQFSTQLKLSKAYQLLKHKKGSVTEICESVGFDSIGSFSHLFKNHFHISPSTLLKN